MDHSTFWPITKVGKKSPAFMGSKKQLQYSNKMQMFSNLTNVNSLTRPVI